MPNARALIVAGGGSGGTWVGGGGGAGGVRYFASLALSVGEIPIIVGNGAPRGTVNSPGEDGEDSSLGSEIALGGGGGGAHVNGWTIDLQGRPGGSGGGSAWGWLTPGAGTNGQGYDGGAGANYGLYYNSGGGGGASEVGGTAAANSDWGTLGGDGFETDISGTSLYYGGGGGGWGLGGGESVKLGGLGGGGHASCGDYDQGDAFQAEDGDPNTGGGGGGGWYEPYGYFGGGGGSGIVIIRYVTADFANYLVTGGTQTILGNDTIRTFTSSGTLSITGTGRTRYPVPSFKRA